MGLELSTLLAECRRLADKIQALEAQLDFCQADLRREREENIALQTTCEELRTALAQLKFVNTQQAGELTLLRPSEEGFLDNPIATALREELLHERARRADMEISYSWRLTAPLRTLLKRFSSP